MDNGLIPHRLHEELTLDIFGGIESDAKEQIMMLPFDEIENMFKVSDLAKIDLKIKTNGKRSPIEIIGKGRKILFSRMFYQKVKLSEITKSDLSAATIANFESAFKWIDEKFTKTEVI
jgi:hypothetical protein